MDQDPPDMSISAPSYNGFNAYMTPYTPQNFGRPSSPLNPHAGSSSPITSPTPQHQLHPHTHFTLHQQLYPIPSSSAGGPSRPPRISRVGRNSLPAPPSPSSSSSTRFARRPTAPSQSRSSSSSGSGLGLGGPLDLFTEGTSPVQGQLWRDRLGRRMEERERRKRNREDDMGRRRGMSDSGSLEDQEAADKRAQEDDEEIFRRLMILQQRKARHAALVSHEREMGGSDPLEPDLWEEEMSQLDKEERELADMVDNHGQSSSQQRTPRQTRRTTISSPSSMTITPQHRFIQQRGMSGGGAHVKMGTYRDRTEEDEDWAEEAAAAEEAEREAEELELLDRVEREYVQGGGGMSGGVIGGVGEGPGMEIDWDELDQMDME